MGDDHGLLLNLYIMYVYIVLKNKQYCRSTAFLDMSWGFHVQSVIKKVDTRLN